MAQKGTAIAGIFLGLLVLVLGLILILAQGWVWTWFESAYSVMGIQAQPSRFWGMFISTIGLAVFVFGLYLIWSAWRKRKTRK